MKYKNFVLTGVCFIILLSLFYLLLSTIKTQEIPQNNFEVVDKYENCDLVRWTNNQLAEYKYFLHCPK